MKLPDLYAALRRSPNEEQRKAIEHLDGPLRIIAGPGSGKSYVLIVRALNLLVCRGVEPSKLVVVTFTEKAAEQLKDRLRLEASRLPTPAQAGLHLAEVNVGTIHWFCGQLLRRHHPTLRRYEPLNDLGQKLFIHRNLDKLCGDLRVGNAYLGRWQSKATATAQLIPWLNKITEETIEGDHLERSGDEFCQMLGAVWSRYRDMLHDGGVLDFSFILRDTYDLLTRDPQALDNARSRFSHFMVDEYQDTNYVQEEVLLSLSQPDRNIAVVGDDDQSLYRFRGATVRNILEFPTRAGTPDRPVREVALETNYRSHPSVISAYTQFMDDGDWDYRGTVFRTEHRVEADDDVKHGDYPAALMADALPSQIATWVQKLLSDGAVKDANEIAFLFHSVSGHAGDTIEALRDLGIDSYAPRARKYLEHEEVRFAVGVLWALAHFADGAAPDAGRLVDLVVDWARDCLSDLEARPEAAALVTWLGETRERWEGLERNLGQDMAASLLDLVYKSFAFEPFASLLDDPVAARNLGFFTQLLSAFQQQLDVHVLHGGNREYLPWPLWSAFFYLLRSAGVDDLDTDDIAPLGMVQVMTIHQAKGLEFPIVFVGGLEKRPRGNRQIDETLSAFYPRGQYEPLSRTTEFDKRREFYVAFSRAESLLVAFSHGTPHKYFAPMGSRLPDATEADWRRLAHALPPSDEVHDERKRVLSLTGHINVYRRCPRQYELYSERGFAPSFAAQVFFGTVVHQTIEDIHRHVLDGRPERLTDELVDSYFLRNSEMLRRRGIHPLAPSQRDEARKHVERYLRVNRDKLANVIDTEVEVTLEQQDYVLNGRVDLIRADDGAIELVDFKAQKRIEEGSEFAGYRDQLALYQSLLEDRFGARPHRAVLYFTGEDEADRARLVVDVSEADIDDVRLRFDETAHSIIAEDYSMDTLPGGDTCRACDFGSHCSRKPTRSST
jgi:DNA helicase-2/ATP-dependent DNA helicase PcrA